MSALYERRPHPPRPLPGGVPRAFYRWPGNVTREQYDAVPYSQRGPLCGHCTNFVTYKVQPVGTHSLTQGWTGLYGLAARNTT